MESPSFNTHSCIADIANRVVQELHNDKEFKDALICFSDGEVNEHQENTQLQEDEFEFPLIFTNSSFLQTDNIIYDHQITPRYPLFDRSLLLNLDSNLGNTDDSKPAPALARAPAPNIVSTITPTSTPITTSAPTLAPATNTVSTLTPTSTPVTASAPTLAPATNTVSTLTPTSTLASAPTLTQATATVSIVTPTSTTASTVRPVTNSDPASPPSARLSLSKLFSEDRDSTRSSNDDLNRISPAETYCVWKPQEQEHQPPKQHHSSRGKHKKSNSISISEETSPKRWRVRDLLKRSYSDDSKHTSAVLFSPPPPKPKTGKDGSSSVVVFLPPSSRKPISNEKVKKPEKSLKTIASMGGSGCANHKPEDKTPAYKAKIGNIRLPAFLPYRQDQHQVDAFANHTNGQIKHMYR